MALKMKELPTSERPYEKMEMYGARSLTNAELLAIIIKNGTKENTVLELANRVLLLGQAGDLGKNSLNFLQDLSIEEFQTIKGIGKVKAIELKAVAELTRRMSKPIQQMKIRIHFPREVAELLMDELKYKKEEVMKLLLLNTKSELQKIIDIASGKENTVSVQPKQILSEAIKTKAPKMILVHNHPSGDSHASSEDIAFTKRIKEASDLLGIQLLDHIVIGNGTYESIFSRKEMNNYGTI